jgi:murein DD-endopeptidase MepM/ murein hydrolase activator NlpD
MTAAMRILVVCLASATLAGCGGGGPRVGPRVISPFGALTSAEGKQRFYGPNIGIDLAAAVGTPVLAAADGLVWSIGDDGPCGTVIVLAHESFGTDGFLTRYCHLSSVRVAHRTRVRRGEVIALTGTSGQRPGIGFEHLHFELRRGWDAIDPMPFIGGCFDRGQTYATNRLVLTYPLAC